jgi:O-antigen/teichoic acid export membrane protein
MKKLSQNLIIALLSRLLTIILGIVAQRFVLASFGSEINGLTSSITQFLSYFTLLEAGLGLASIQALYKPIAHDDRRGVAGILAATTRQYRSVGILFLALTAVLAACMPFISNSTLSHGLVFIITLLMGGSNVLNYLFIGRYQVILSADRKTYIIHTLDAMLGIGFNIIRIIMINSGATIVAVQLTALGSPLMRMLILHAYVKRQYPYAFDKVEPDFASIGKRKHVLVHQLVGMITNHTDVTILTVCATLSHVSVYSVYNLIYGNINSVLSMTFSTAAQASFGRLIESKDKRLNEYYDLYETIFTCMLFCLLAAVIVMTVPFVRLYTDGVVGIDYVDPILAVLFMISILFSATRLPAITMVNATGSFQQTQKGAIYEAIINIVISIPAFFAIGMRGLLLGTCIAMCYRALDIQIYTYRFILKEKLGRWIRLFLLNAALLAVYMFVFMDAAPISTESWLEWMALGVRQMAISALWFGTICGVVYREKLRQVLRIIRHKM